MDNCKLCQKPSTSRCAKCHQIFYCSRECQKEDWNEHKKSCGNSPVVKNNETIDENFRKFPIMNDCKVCQKPSTSKCAKCHQIFYCSRECQKEDWNEHKKSCGNSPVIKNNENFPNFDLSLHEMTEFLTNMMLRMNKGTVTKDWDVPEFGKEYATKYPHEKEQIKCLNSARSSLKGMQIIDKIIDSDINEPDPGHILKRWMEFSNTLLKFLSSPRKIGDIFTGKTKGPYVRDKGRVAQSFSNMPKQSLTLIKGRVHVAVGFVDLDFLLRARIVQNKSSIERPNKFIGYEGSIYAVAKTNVIKEMMMNKAPIRSIIEVWFSTVWTTETLKNFENAVKNVLQYGNAPNRSPPNPTKKELHPKVRSLISHWIKSIRSPKSRQEAHRLWIETFDSEERVFAVVANLIEPRDRVQAARYILTGEFPLMDDQQQKNLIASITMFNCNDGISPHSTSEFMLEMMPMDAILLEYKREDTIFLDAIYNFLENAIAKVCDWLSPPIGKAEMIEIYLHFQSITNDNSALLASIRQLEPWTISWSNLCDYFYTRDFHKLLRECSGDDTVHVMTSMNWISEIFGAHIMDHKSKYRREIIRNAQTMISMIGNSMDPSGYFRYTQVITHPYNVGDIGATMMVKDKWLDYFLKGQELNVGDVTFELFAHTHRIHTLLNIYFTYSKKFKVYSTYV
ncbi:hypothetical protein C1645_840398 [Glomus cerebriforme]|uniref:MYND-type domain-containing protein n=1 Tax=Glomus cerebriforme TaxID=658196 RepID=A0A397S5G5_9GLOM|nr:hypothetical protein C1645_840398 [Glomus cerebriforme]